MSLSFKPGKLLISMVGRNRAEQYVSATKAAGARGGTIMYGRSVGENPIMLALSLADVQQEIVFTLMGDEQAAVLEAALAAAREQPKKFGGMALLLDVAAMLIRVKPGDDAARNFHQEEHVMESGFKLITVIVNNGYADDVMAAARKAGAAGGTILNARGTGTAEDVKFFAITLVPEKEVLLIVTPDDKAEPIVAAINEVPHLCEPGGGIVYTMNVERFIILGK
jgi:nitrogen regulatory protein PII